MKSIHIKFVAFIVSLAIFLIPLFLVANLALAQDDPTPLPTTGQLKNPLGFCADLDGYDCLMNLVKEILEIVWKIGIPFIVLAIMYCGFLFVMARGDPAGLKKAKATLMWVLVGGAIILGSWVIATVISETIKDIGAAV